MGHSFQEWLVVLPERRKMVQRFDSQTYGVCLFTTVVYVCLWELWVSSHRLG